jgi:hypothetical protein
MVTQPAGPVAWPVEFPAAYGAAPDGVRPLAAQGATHRRRQDPP